MLADGDRASNGDVWLRILTSEGQITKGKLHHAAFKGTIKPIHADKNRPWSSEMSGRLRSLAGSIDDIKNHATAYCARKSQKYSGVAFGRCADLKINFPNSPVSSAVHYTPIDKPPDTDRAHADLTF